MSKQSDKVEATEFLQRFLDQGGTIYGIVRSVARSGMSRHISYVGFKAGEAGAYALTYRFAQVLGVKCHRNRGGDTVRINGCGMDMVWATAHNVIGDQVADRSKYGGIL